MIAALIFALVLGDAPLEDPAEEARAQALMQEIRCVACENEPISQSASDIARDMRRAVRNQIAAGAEDDEVRNWFAERYGDFVLFRPKASGGGALLWAFPFILLAGVGAVLMLAAMRARRRFEASPAKDHENPSDL
ncbi:MAG: cytochrome c-type biogenesis protein [Pseudomonadota bacterium]